MSLSVVLITKNEQRNIAPLIESVLERTRDMASVDVMVVDSNSTDDTVAIACRYPVTVVRIEPAPDIRMCAAAGRFVGGALTRGEFILFLDGDHELCDGWIESAFRIFEATPDIGVVGGFRVDVPRDTPPGATELPHVAGDTFEDAGHAGPAAMYRRSVYESAGGFTPFLISDEEPDLSTRIRHAGHRVVRTSRAVVVHRTDPENTFAAVRARRRRNLYVGFGQNLRYMAGTGLTMPYLLSRTFVLPALGAVVAAGAALLMAVIKRSIAPLIWWFVLVAAAVAGFAVKKGSIYAAAHSAFVRIVVLEGFVRGVWIPPLDRAAYLRQATPVCAPERQE